MAISEAQAKLLKVLQEAGISETEPTGGKEFLAEIAGQGVGSTDDFLGFVATQTYEEDWKEFCMRGPADAGF